MESDMENTMLLLLASIDGALTGRVEEAVREIQKIKDHGGFDMEDFCFNNREYYLSDGGYSRLVIYESGLLGVTSNSTQKVKDLWHEDVGIKNGPIAELKRRIEKCAREWRVSQGLE